MRKGIKEMANDFIKLLQRVFDCFPDGFLNRNFEFIVDRRANSYFSMNGVNDEADIGVRLLSSLSRDAYKSEPFATDRENRHFHARITSGLERWFQMSFSYDDLEMIYTYLGNGIRNDLARRFITEGKLDTRWLLLEVRKEKGLSV